MSKLPSGMRRRGRCYIMRDRKGLRADGKRIDRWINLGTDRERAEAEFYRVRGGGRPVARITVGDAAKRWLAEYVPTRRNEKNRRDAAARVRIYLAPRLGEGRSVDYVRSRSASIGVGSIPSQSSR